jgi:hypothetical protein
MFFAELEHIFSFVAIISFSSGFKWKMFFYNIIDFEMLHLKLWAALN